MENLKIEDLKKDLYVGDFGDCFRDYDNGYIGDIITEIADYNVNIYTSDLLEWAKGNYSYIEEALDEFGTPQDDNGKADFIRTIQQGQYYANERNLYENLEDSLKMFMYDYIKKDLNIKELTEEQNNELLECFDFTDNNEQLENLIENINEILKIKN